jgi:hypothetical protein
MSLERPLYSIFADVGSAALGATVAHAQPQDKPSFPGKPIRFIVRACESGSARPAADADAVADRAHRLDEGECSSPRRRSRRCRAMNRRPS